MDVTFEQVRIRNAGQRDCEQLARWWNDGRVMAHAGFPNGLGTTAAEIEQQIATDSDDTKRRLIIEYRSAPIGEMSFYVYSDAKYEIGIKICEDDHQDRGLGKIILSMLIGELFRMEAKLIFLDTNLKNARAQHVYEELGFRKVGIRHDSWRNQLGELQSSVDYELTKEDFRNFAGR